MLEVVNYFAHGMEIGFPLFQAGFYTIMPRGIMPYLSAKYDIEFPGF